MMANNQVQSNNSFKKLAVVPIEEDSEDEEDIMPPQPTWKLRFKSLTDRVKNFRLGRQSVEESEDDEADESEDEQPEVSKNTFQRQSLGHDTDDELPKSDQIAEKESLINSNRTYLAPPIVPDPEIHSGLEVRRPPNVVPHIAYRRRSSIALSK